MTCLGCEVVHSWLLSDDLPRVWNGPFTAVAVVWWLAEGVKWSIHGRCLLCDMFADTSFMYIIACLSMLKIYEMRHPDVQAKAYRSYFSMALVIFIAVLGVVSHVDILPALTPAHPYPASIFCIYVATVFHSINSPSNFPLFYSVLSVLFLPYLSFQLYISVWKSPSALI